MAQLTAGTPGTPNQAHFAQASPSEGIRHIGGAELTLMLSRSQEQEQACCQQVIEREAGRMALHVNLEGGCTVEQGEQVVSMRPGDLLLLDLAQLMPSARLRYRGNVRHITLIIPSEPLTSRLGKTAALTLLEDGRGIGAIIGSLLRALYEQAGAIDGASAAMVMEHATTLLVAAIHRQQSQSAGKSSPANAARLRQIQEYIEAHLDNPDLDPAQVAAASGVSVRYLYKLFAEQNSSVSGWIRERRLVQCAEALSSPKLAHRNIAELAFASGLSDLSAFGRAFKRRFGMTPRDYRRRALAGHDSPPPLRVPHSP